MDAVVSGLIAGASASLLILFTGIVVYFSNRWHGLLTPESLFTWLIILTGLTVGQLGVTGLVLQKLSAGPSQAKEATAA